MELDVLRGAKETLKRCAPVILVETLKTDAQDIRKLLADVAYADCYEVAPNMLAISERDPLRQHVSLRDNVLCLG